MGKNRKKPRPVVPMQGQREREREYMCVCKPFPLPTEGPLPANLPGDSLGTWRIKFSLAGLVKAVNTAVDLIVAHFGTSRDPGVKVGERLKS